MRDIKYFYEKDGQWLSKNRKLTIDPHKAWSYDNLEDAEFYLALHNWRGHFLGFEITEHEFI